MLGDRFKNKLPRFIGEISDFNDLFIAEDKEFERLEGRIQDLINSSFIYSISKLKNPDPVLERLEKIFNIKSEKLTRDERINSIITKLRGRDVTTRALVVSICKAFGYDVRFIKKYEEYAFLLEVFGDMLPDKVVEILETVKPAHLKLLIDLIFAKYLILETQAGDYTYPQFLCGEHKCGLIPKPIYVGTEYRTFLSIVSGLYDSLDYRGQTGDGHRSGELRGEKIQDLYYLQSFGSDKILKIELGDGDAK